MNVKGGLKTARRLFYEKRPSNLHYLLQKRYSWMNKYCQGKEVVIEMGSGPAFSREYISHPLLKTTDYKIHPWIDLQVDALRTGFSNESVDVVISTHVIHPLAGPVVFFLEMHRILKPGGYLLVQEIEVGLLMRMLLRLMRHEGWSFEARVFDETSLCNDPKSPWSANCAIPHLLFKGSEEFEKKVAGFRMLKNEFCECLTLVLSGGVVAKRPTINLPRLVLRLMDVIDSLLITISPSIFALGRRVVLQKAGQPSP